MKVERKRFFVDLLKKKEGKVCRFIKKQYLCTRIQGNASY